MPEAPRRYVNPRIETASRADIEALQLMRLRNVVTRAYETNPFYRRLYDKARVKPDQIRTLKDFQERIPFIEKRTLLEDQAEYPPYGSRAMVPGAEIHLVAQTSGTSGIGQELHILSQKDSEAWTTGFFYECRWAGIESGDRVARFARVAMEVGGMWHVNSGERYGLTQFFLNPYDTPMRLRLLQRLSPHLIMTQPSYLTRLSLTFDEAGLEPKKALPDLKAILFAGEAHSGAPWLRRMEAFWGVKLGEWYGSTQAAGSHMFSCEHGLYRDDGSPRMLHNLEHRILFEALDRETRRPVGDGEDGEVVLTNLVNDTFPIIRFRNHDRVRFRPHTFCECGRPFAGIESGSVSRYDDMIKLRGQNVWPDAVGAAVFANEAVEEFQGVVWVDEHGREQVRLSVEFRPGTVREVVRTSTLDSIRAAVKAKTDLTMEVVEAPHGTLPRFEQKARRWTDKRRESRNDAAAKLEYRKP